MLWIHSILPTVPIFLRTLLKTKLNKTLLQKGLHDLNYLKNILVYLTKRQSVISDVKCAHSLLNKHADYKF